MEPRVAARIRGLYREKNVEGSLRLLKTGARAVADSTKDMNRSRFALYDSFLGVSSFLDNNSLSTRRLLAPAQRACRQLSYGRIESLPVSRLTGGITKSQEETTLQIIRNTSGRPGNYATHPAERDRICNSALAGVCRSYIILAPHKSGQFRSKVLGT